MSVRGRLGAIAVLCGLAATACTPLPVAAGSTTTKTPVTAPTSTPSPTPTPSPTSSLTAPTYPGVMLQFGMTSPAVALVQRKLGVAPATSYFGAVTEAAVKAFQKEHGLEIDGQVGPLTWAMIFGSTVTAPIPVTSTPVSTTPVSTTPVSTTPVSTTPVSTTPAPTRPPAPPSYPAIVRQAGLGAKALALIATYAGKPYLWGAAGPNAFDCSGLTQYVYKQLGVLLQRSADQQFRTTLHVPYSQAQPGDLIFFYDSTGYVYHVGMYAGNGMMWDAPHSGAVVRYENVWYPNSVWVGVPGAKLAS